MRVKFQNSKVKKYIPTKWKYTDVIQVTEYIQLIPVSKPKNLSSTETKIYKLKQIKWLKIWNLLVLVPASHSYYQRIGFTFKL